MTLKQKKDIVRKILVSVIGIFMPKDDATDIITTTKDVIIDTTKAYADAKTLDGTGDSKSYIDTELDTIRNSIGSITDDITSLDTVMTNIATAIRDISTLNTFIGEYDTYTDMTNVTTDSMNNPLSPGDFAELHINNDKPSGLYRYTSNGWSDVPFINYENITGIDPISQDEIDNAIGI